MRGSKIEHTYPENRLRGLCQHMQIAPVSVLLRLSILLQLRVLLCPKQAQSLVTDMFGGYTDSIKTSNSMINKAFDSSQSLIKLYDQ